MPDSHLLETVGPATHGKRSRREGGEYVHQSLWGNPRSRLGSCWLLAMVIIAIAAPWVARYSPAAQDVLNPFGSPSWEHWLGTDDLGRDVWSRLVYGTRASMQASLIAVGIAIGLGVPIGLVAGYKGGWLDTILMRIVDTVLSFPGIVLAIGITAALGTGLVKAMIAVGVVFAPSLARVSRGQVLATKERGYVDAAVSFGSPSARTLIRHIIPNSIQPVIVQATFMLGLAMLAEASLSFVGLGVQYPDPSFGVMLRRAAQFISRQPGAVYPPGLAIALTVWAFNTLGDSIRDTFDPRTNTHRRLERAARRDHRQNA